MLSRSHQLQLRQIDRQIDKDMATIYMIYMHYDVVESAIIICSIDTIVNVVLFDDRQICSYRFICAYQPNDMIYMHYDVLTVVLFIQQSMLCCCDDRQIGRQIDIALSVHINLMIYQHRGSDSDDSEMRRDETHYLFALSNVLYNIIR